MCWHDNNNVPISDLEWPTRCFVPAFKGDQGSPTPTPDPLSTLRRRIVKTTLSLRKRVKHFLSALRLNWFANAMIAGGRNWEHPRGVGLFTSCGRFYKTFSLTSPPLKRKTGRFQTLPVCFNGPFSFRINMDGRPNRRHKGVFSNFSVLVNMWTLPYCLRLLLFSLCIAQCCYHVPKVRVVHVYHVYCGVHDKKTPATCTGSGSQLATNICLSQKHSQTANFCNWIADKNSHENLSVCHRLTFSILLPFFFSLTYWGKFQPNKQLPFSISTIKDITEKIKIKVKNLVVYFFHLETNSVRNAPGQAKNKSVVYMITQGVQTQRMTVRYSANKWRSNDFLTGTSIRVISLSC